jgi:predicted phage terminase large subunit-like protein
MYTSHGMWKTAPHLRYLCKVIQNVAERKMRHVIVTMPPRHGKSEVISKTFPAWYLGNYPDDEVILSSYGAKLAFNFSRIARNKFSDFGSEIFNLELAKDSSAVDNWKIENHSGGLSAAGVGGSLTGKGARIAIIDDPLKGREAANSANERERVIEWFKSTVFTRLTPDGSIIIVLTRWHTNDLAGELLKNFPDKYTLINFPAIAEENDVLGRKAGDPLWPDRFNLTTLNEIKEQIGTYEWLSLYQQRPVALEGNIFKRNTVKYVDTIPEGLEIYQTVDPAISLKTTADYFVLLTYGIQPESKDIFLIDLFVGRLSFTEQCSTIINYYTKWHPLSIGIESVAYQAALSNTLSEKTFLPIKPLHPVVDKLTRAMRITPKFEAGKVYIYKKLPFIGLLEEQLFDFPNGEHDDIVDTISAIADMTDIQARWDSKENWGIF